MIDKAIQILALKGILLISAATLLCLLALWASVSRRHWFLRWCAVASVLALGLPIAAYDLMLTVFIGSAVVAGIFAMNRWFRQWRQSSGSRHVRTRFSLADLLLGTSAVGMMVAVAVRVPELVWRSWASLLEIGFLFASLTVAAACAAWDERRIWLGIVLLIVVAPLAGYSLRSIEQLNFDNSAWMLVLGVAVALLILTWLLLARRAARLAAVNASSVLVVALTLLLVTPLVAAYWKLITPDPIPVMTMPAPNGFDRLLKIAPSFRAQRDPVLMSTEAELAAFVATNGSQLREAHAAIRMPLKLFVSFTSSPSLNELVNLRGVARAICAEARLAEFEGRTEDALSNYLDVMRFGRAMSEDGKAIEWLTAKAIEGLGWYGVSHNRGGLNRAERQNLLNTIQRDFQPPPWPGPHHQRQLIYEQYAYGWGSRLHVVLERFVGIDRTADSGYGDIYREWKAMIDLLCIDLALMNYQADHGALPDRLIELTPDFLASVPDDPFSGKPFVYRREGDLFALYSIGRDLHDDGGKIPNTWDVPSDITLPPARSDAIQEQ